MSDDHDDGHDHDPDDTPEHESDLARVTAPQGPYSMRDVGIGFVVLALGLALTFGLALGLA